MEIKNSLYTFDSDFDVLPMCNMFLENRIALTENGSHATFVCPTKIKINGAGINVPNAFNVCYILPNCTRKEIVYFSMLYNREIAKTINHIFHGVNLEENASVIFNDDKLLGVSFIKHFGDAGIAWHSVFIDPPDVKADIQFDKLPIVEDNKEESLKAMHTEALNRFQLLRNHVLMTSITLAQPIQQK